MPLHITQGPPAVSDPARGTHARLSTGRAPVFAPPLDITTIPSAGVPAVRPGLLRRLGGLVCRGKRARFYVRDSSHGHAVSPTGLRVEWVDVLTPSSQALLAGIRGRDLAWTTRFARGHRCAVAFDGSAPVGYVWVSPGAWRLDDREWPAPLAPDVAFLYDGFVSRAARGRGTFAWLMAAVCEELRSEGCPRACTVVRDSNLPSRRSVARVGFEPTESFGTSWCVLGVWRFRTGSPPASLLPDGRA